jgi:hypothetical protein
MYSKYFGFSELPFTKYYITELLEAIRQDDLAK